MDRTEIKRIMVIGGDSHFSYLMQRYVGTSEHQIVFARLGEDMLAQARCHKPAAIVLHVDTPETIGWQTLKVLKSDLEIGKIPVIICSWLDDETRCMQMGADFFLQMPILYADFEAALVATLLKEKNGKSS
jgi:CheY-like chemotaxis protein